MLKKILKNSNLIFLFLSIAVGLFASIGFLHSGFPLTDDGNWMVIRFSAFYESLHAGQIPVRFLMRLNNGFGYPVADFLYPLFMYLGVPIQLLTHNFILTVKTELILSMILSCVFCFLWLKKFFDNLSSFIGASSYTLFPYHLFDLYKRGSVGEIVSIALLPFIFWQFERRSLLFSSVGIAFIILAHNTLAIMFGVLILAYAILDIFIDKKMFFFYLKSFLFGLTLSSFFWIPAIYDLQFTVFSKTNISDWSAYFSNIQQIGISSLLALVVFILFVLAKKINLQKHRLSALFLIFALIFLFLSSSLSYNLWNYLPVSFIQFPFRFLSVLLISCSFLLATVVSVVSRKEKYAVSAIILVLLFFESLNFVNVKNYQFYPDTFYSTNQDSTTVRNEYMPKWVNNIAQNSNHKVVNLSGEEKVDITSNLSNKTEFETNLVSNKIFQINTVYFPGWNVYVNGKNVNIDYNSNGLIRFNLLKGQNKVTAVFAETPLRFFSDTISVLGLIFFCIYLLYIKNKHEHI